MRYTIALIILFLGSTFLAGFYYFEQNPIKFSRTSELGNSDEDIDVNRASIEELFKRGEYYFNHSEDSHDVYDLTKARYYYELAVNRQPDGHALAWYQLGRIDFLEGKFDPAIEKFNNQIKYFGDKVPSVYYMIGLTYGYKARAYGDPEDWKKAEEGFSKFLEFMPSSPWARTDLTWLYFAQGKYEDMKPVLEEGLKYEPNSPWLHNMYGLALLNTGSPQEAVNHFRHALILASKLTVEDWGRAYPGNHPQFWQEGLDSFLRAINENIRIAEEAS